MSNRMVQKLRQWWGQWWRGRWWQGTGFGLRSRIEPHPPLAGDRDERRLEQARFEAETRHVGRGTGAAPEDRAADAPPTCCPGPASPAARPARDPRRGPSATPTAGERHERNA